jgi:hypothetical protein
VRLAPATIAHRLGIRGGHQPVSASLRGPDPSFLSGPAAGPPSSPVPPAGPPRHLPS